MTKKRFTAKETRVSNWEGIEVGADARVTKLRFNTNTRHSLASNITALSEAMVKHLGELPALARLNLTVCPLRTLPDSIGQLQSLTSLRLFKCFSLTTLPDSIGQLQALASLDLKHCTSLRTLPDSIGQLQSLPQLNLQHCTSLMTLPDSIGQLQSLASLGLCHCESLTQLPESIGQLQALASLDVNNCLALTGHEAVVVKLKARNVTVYSVRKKSRFHFPPSPPAYIVHFDHWIKFFIFIFIFWF